MSTGDDLHSLEGEEWITFSMGGKWISLNYLLFPLHQTLVPQSSPELPAASPIQRIKNILTGLIKRKRELLHALTAISYFNVGEQEHFCSHFYSSKLQEKEKKETKNYKHAFKAVKNAEYLCTGLFNVLVIYLNWYLM